MSGYFYCVDDCLYRAKSGPLLWLETGEKRTVSPPLADHLEDLWKWGAIHSDDMPEIRT